MNIPRARDRGATQVALVDPAEVEAVAAVERVEIEARLKARARAKHHIALAGIGPLAGIGATGADNQFVNAVTVDGSHACDGAVAAVIEVEAFDAEAVGAVEP